MSQRKSKRQGKSKKEDRHSIKSSSTAQPVFGVPLDVACDRSPSHDGVPLPAFFRNCIDYLEQYGLDTEDLYQVRGIKSQRKTLISALNRGEAFAQIAATSASFSSASTHDVGPTRTARAAFGILDVGAKTKPNRMGSIVSPARHVNEPRSKINTHSHLPHDIAVVASVIKHFLRHLPDPVITESLHLEMESILADASNIHHHHHSVAKLVHTKLPQSHRFLLAWMLQHIQHIIDHSEVNRMTLANISVALSPYLNMSPHLLAFLLKPTPADVSVDILKLAPSLNSFDRTANKDKWHWLFPHPDYELRPYQPPLRLVSDLELPEGDADLDLEMQKQQSLLSHLHKLIARGDSTSEIENLFWETQHLLTEIKRRKSLNDPEVIRAELNRQQAQLDRVHKAMIAELGTTAPPGIPQSGVGGDSTLHRRRNKGKSPQASSFSDELWSIQRHITMLKRRLKQKEHGQHQSSLTGHSNDPIPPGSNVVMLGSIPLRIPTLAELDEEEQLNLTMRKLPVDVSTTACDELTTVPVQMPLPDVTLQRPPSASLTANELEPERHGSPVQLLQVSVEQEKTTPVIIVTQSLDTNEERLRPKQTAERDSSLERPETHDSFSTEALKPMVNVVYQPNPRELLLSRQVALYSTRRQELEAIQADLKTRIQAEKSEIERIETRISAIVRSGNAEVERAYADYVDGFDLSYLDSFGTCSLTLSSDRPWTRLAERLNQSVNTVEPRVSSVAPSSSDDDDVTNGSEESPPRPQVAYARLTDEDHLENDEDDEEGEGHVSEAELAQTLYQLILDNARLEQLNCRYMEGILSERNLCAELKVLLKLRNTTNNSETGPRAVLSNSTCL